MTSSSYCNTAGYIFIISFLIYWYLVKKRGMYLSWSESYLKSKAKAKSLNVRPIKPHIHANLKVCMWVWCVWGSLLSIIVGHETSPQTWILFFIFYFNFDVKFCPTDWKLMGYRMRIGNTKNGDPFYGQTLCHTWVAKPRYHCIVSSPWFYLSVGWRHEMYET